MSATYQSFSLTEVQTILRPKHGWGFADLSGGSFPCKEHVLDWAIPDGPAEGLRLRVYTSVQCSTNMTRSAGTDAIRVCVPKRIKARRINRTPGWPSRLVALVREVLATIQEIEGKKAVAKGAAVAEAKAGKSYTEAAMLLERAAGNGLKYPKITLNGDGGVVVRFALAGAKSKYHGDVMIGNAEQYGSSFSKWYGNVHKGAWLKSKSVTPEVAALVDAFEADPIGTIVALGKKTGHCQFCMKELGTGDDSEGSSGQKSLAVGYGPVCAKNWGLPW